MKYKVHGRIRADIPVSEIVSAPTEEIALEKVQEKICKRSGINAGGYIDDELYCEELE